MTTKLRARNENVQRILEAAANGNVDVLKPASDHELRTFVCHSGCTALHWAAGCNQMETLEYLIHERHLSVDSPAVKKSRDRTPLHYASRNGCLTAAKWLVANGANPDARAKHGVTPFQLAVWQNQFDLCRWLVEETGGVVDPAQTNDFCCGAVHWLGLCPHGRTPEEGNDGGLLPLAKWLSQQPGIDFHLRQRQGHTPLHKAAWGGHLRLIQYYRTEHELWDEFQDDAGNFAADLADMADTEEHAKIAQYLRAECSRARAQSCAILGVEASATPAEMRKAYLDQAKHVHPDRSVNEGGDFDVLHKAYRHLMDEGGCGNQSNPAHSLHLMLRVSGLNDNVEGQKTDQSCFKARLIAVLLEYGDKGLDLSNVKKKWKQVWPKEPFPVHGEETSKKRTSLSQFLLERAGDVISLEQDEKGVLRVYAKECSQAKVAKAAKDGQIPLATVEAVST